MKEKKISHWYGYVSFILFLLALGIVSYKGFSLYQNSKTPTAMSGIRVGAIEGWANLDRQARDIQILGKFILLTNSVPPWGRGPEDGKPFIVLFDLRNQALVWEARYTATAPIVANAQTLFVVKDSQLAALDLNNGNEIWSVPFADLGLSQVFCNDNLVLAANKEALFTFDALTGELLWQSDLPVPLDLSVPDITDFASWREYSALGIHGSTIYARKLNYHDVNECRFTLFALDADAGSERWHYSIQQPNHGECFPGTFPLVFSDGVVLVETLNSRSGSCMLNALSEDSGEVIWSQQIIGGCSAQSFAFDGKFYLVLSQNILVIEAKSGRVLEQQDRPSGIPQQTMGNHGWIILLSGNMAEKILSLVDLRSGKLLSKTEVSLPDICNLSKSLAGFYEDKIVLVTGNCIRSFGLSEDGRLEP